MKKSQYSGVHWNKSQRNWTAKLHANKKKHLIGNYNTELEAALNVNAKCDELGIPHRNKTIGSKKSKVTE